LEHKIIIYVMIKAISDSGLWGG